MFDGGVVLMLMAMFVSVLVYVCLDFGKGFVFIRAIQQSTMQWKAERDSLFEALSRTRLSSGGQNT